MILPLAIKLYYIIVAGIPPRLGWNVSAMCQTCPVDNQQYSYVFTIIWCICLVHKKLLPYRHLAKIRNSHINTTYPGQLGQTCLEFPFNWLYPSIVFCPYKHSVLPRQGRMKTSYPWLGSYQQLSKISRFIQTPPVSEVDIDFSEGLNNSEYRVY